MGECTPLAHIIGNDEQDRCNSRHRDHSGKWHQDNKYDDQCDGVDYSGNGCTSAVFDIGSSSCNCTCGRIPPNKAEAILPAPCATSSMSERCFPLIIPSATTQERSDSMAASTAMVNAFGIAFWTICTLTSGRWNEGRNC